MCAGYAEDKLKKKLPKKNVEGSQNKRNSGKMPSTDLRHWKEEDASTLQSEARRLKGTIKIVRYKECERLTEHWENQTFRAQRSLNQQLHESGKREEEARTREMPVREIKAMEEEDRPTHKGKQETT